MPNPFVSVIVLNYNGIQYLDKCLGSIRSQTYSDFEVILVDNASSDGSAQLVRDNFQSVKIIENKENLGYARANNEAAKGTVGDYMLFLNADTWAEPNLLEALVSRATRESRIGVCACTQSSYDSKIILNSGLASDLLSYPSTRPRKEILYADGASIFVAKSVFTELRGFDSAYFLYGEDLDFCWRALLSGYEVVSVPTAVVRHDTGGTYAREGKTYEIKRWRRYLVERNSLRTILKNYSFKNLIWILPIRMTVMLYEMLLLLGMRKNAFAADILRAVRWNFTHFSETLTLRGFIQNSRRQPDKAVMRRMSKDLAIVTALVNLRRVSGISWVS